MTEGVDFSRNAAVYDRRHGAVLAESAARRLAAAADLAPGARVLDVGAGTGRAAIALATLGFRVVAVDPARPMIDSLRAKAARLPLHAVAAAAAQLPVSPRSFDAVVLARLLYLLPNWREAVCDAIRALTPGGRLLHEWGNGSADEEWVQIREQARALFEHAGVASPFHPGVRSEAEVDEFLRRQGLTPIAVTGLGPGAPSTLAEFLDRIASGEISYTWSVPAEIQRRCLPSLRAWAERAYDLNQLRAIPREISWTIYR
jgi:SAM-dependent methyltransferase